jgi:predicted GNAT family N-acyltransferase
MREYIAEPLSADHNRADFCCGESTLDDYLRKYAGQDQKRREAAVFIYTVENQIAGYYTLSALQVDTSEFPEPTLKKLRLSSYPKKPATLLGRLAVDQKFQKNGKGKLILVDALKRSYYQSTQIGSVAVAVDALNDNAPDFYRHFGFVQLTTQPNRLVLPMKTIAGLFEA